MFQYIQLRRVRGWRLPADAVVVTRPTLWGNPYVVVPGLSTAEQAVAAYARDLADARAGSLSERAVRRWETWSRYGASAPFLILARIGELRGRPLACWCPPGGPCHAHVLHHLARCLRAQPRVSATARPAPAPPRRLFARRRGQCSSAWWS